jgi:heterotetrameric sarcosine oxidase gamma subunit
VAEIIPVARSPIAPAPPEVVVDGWAVSGRRSSAGVTLTDCTPLAKIAVKATFDGAMADSLGVAFGRSAREDCGLGPEADVLVIGSGPGEWLVLGPPARGTAVLNRLEEAAARTDELVTVVDVTHGRALVRLTGEKSPELLAKECGVDLADDMCPDGAAFRSAVARVATDIVRDDLAGSRSYLLHCERSSGQYLFDSLLDAGREFGVEVDGFVAPDVPPE